MKKQATGFAEYLKVAADYMGEFGINFNIQAVNRFMESCHKSEPVSLADAQQVTVLLESLIHGARNSSDINIGKELRELFEIPRHREKRYTPEDIASGSEVHQAVIDYILATENRISLEDKKISKTTYVDTVKKVAQKLSVGDREAERVIKKIKDDILPITYVESPEENN